MENDIKAFVRNHFEDGMLLCAADLINMQAYNDAKRRLGYCGLMGCGIVFGLTAEADYNFITVKSGLAIDSKGREIYLPADRTISLSGLLTGETVNGEWFLCVEYAEEPCGEAFAISSEKLRKTVYNRIKESFKLKAKRSRDSGDICVAGFAVNTQSGTAQISSIRPPVDAFHFAPVWENFLPKYSRGVVYVGQDEPMGADGVFRSKEIHHGLGVGKAVGIELSINTYDDWQASEIYGDPRLFGLPVTAAARLYPDKGSFVIAVKPDEPLTSPICIRWYARVLHGDNGYV